MGGAGEMYVAERLSWFLVLNELNFYNDINLKKYIYYSVICDFYVTIHKINSYILLPIPCTLYMYKILSFPLFYL